MGWVFFCCLEYPPRLFSYILERCGKHASLVEEGPRKGWWVDWWWKRVLQARAGKASGSSTLGTDTPPAWGKHGEGRSLEKPACTAVRKELFNIKGLRVYTDPLNSRNLWCYPRDYADNVHNDLHVKETFDCSAWKFCLYLLIVIADGGRGCSYLNKLDPTLH